MQGTESCQKYTEKSHHLTCRNCLYYTLPTNIPTTFCYECQSLNSCPKSINYCGTCLDELKHFALKECNLCNTKHLFKWTFCVICTQFVERNENDPNYYSIFCSNHTNYCLHCKKDAYSGINCSLGHKYHQECFYKYPQTIKHCKFCTEIAGVQIASLIGNSNGEFCSLCNTFQADSIVTCLSKYFFCGYCLASNNFAQFNIDCFCDRCEKYKRVQRKFIENWGKCNKCKVECAMKYKSICGTITLCERCIENNYLKVYICGCQKCFDNEKNFIKSCSLCEATDLVSDKGRCINENYYCEGCLVSPNIAKKIAGVCNCEFCVEICMKESEILHEEFKCLCCYRTNNRILNRSGCINRLYFCKGCRNPQNPSLFKCSCKNCSQFQIYNPNNSILFCQNHPKRKKQLTLGCGHNFCYGCLISVNYFHFVSFFNFYASNEPDRLQSIFKLNCPENNCDHSINLSAGFLIEKLNILMRYGKSKIELFSPYFEGLSFTFYKCKCGHIVAANNDVVIGCSCKENVGR